MWKTRGKGKDDEQLSAAEPERRSSLIDD